MEASVVSPQPASQPRQVTPYPTFKESWGFIGWYLLVTIVGGIGLVVVFLLVLPHKHKEDIPTLLLGVLSDLLLLGFLYWHYGRRMMRLQVRGQVPGWLYAALPLLTVAAIMVLSLLDFLTLPNWFETVFKSVAQQPAQAILLGGIIIPVLEEVLFRGVLLQGLLRHQRPWVAIGQQALLFGLIHFNPAQSVSAFLIGLLLGWLCYRTGSLLLGIGIHALNNLLAFGLLIWLPEVAHARTALPEYFGSYWIYAGLVVVATAVLVLLLRRVSRLALPVAWASASASPNLPNPPNAMALNPAD